MLYSKIADRHIIRGLVHSLLWTLDFDYLSPVFCFLFAVSMLFNIYLYLQVRLAELRSTDAYQLNRTSGCMNNVQQRIGFIHDAVGHLC